MAGHDHAGGRRPFVGDVTGKVHAEIGSSWPAGSHVPGARPPGPQLATRG